MADGLRWIETNDQVWIAEIGPFHLMVGKCFVPGRSSNPSYKNPDAYRVLVGLDWMAGERKYGIGANQPSRIIARDEVLTVECAKIRAIELLANEASERRISDYPGEELIKAELARIKRSN